jgi:homocysteine S-methyltransferase
MRARDRRDVRRLLAEAAFVLAEGAVIERLRREFSVLLDPDILHAGFVYRADQRAALESIYRQYVDIGRRHDVPMIVLTPTWRASGARVTRTACAVPSPAHVNRDCARYLTGLVSSYGKYGQRVYVGGMLGPAGDAYRPQEALPAQEAEAYHAAQARALAETGVDFLMAATLPAYSEALGLARAMARYDVPYVLSFVLLPTGTLLDGSPLHRAVQGIDAGVSLRPVGYMVNCVHPTVFERALAHELNSAPGLCERVIGLQGNTSCRSPEELDNSSELQTEKPHAFAAAMARVHERFALSVLGGCCGTDDRHIDCVARFCTQL